ncbi:conserved hypothetical protein [Abyssogena phaseoliformis symbiont OG214]|uniref:hypothetical protein n=1 Tax=Abyssogena phaseoliformis symbiont TaxID=596095 RepID=UPI0019150B42|nr:hypothetical protein [Abyssogena phaseoliformis symbiont]MBW5289224.1 hypothetical protein [Candidatus Ruthia sp. Apha_13_S6]BBB22747.1 conserved hypothetical protein [Abyssogena phaseoliformis symbiont OG214]
MKKIFAIVLLAFILSANAFWNNNTPRSNGYNNHNGYGYQEDNGMFGYNPYDFWDPRWYPEEMGNMFDEFDNNGWNNNNNNYYGYGRNGYGYGFAPNSYVNTPWGPGVAPNMATPVVPTAR